jgi:hypothetical protein
MTGLAFVDWVVDELGLTEDQVEAIKLIPVFDVFISRVEAARVCGASDPLQTVTAKEAGGNSRACTKRMLEQLGLTPAARRAAHRLFAGSPSGWPGLLRLYSTGTSLTLKQRQYCRRQVAILLSASAQETELRNGASASCSARAATP